MLAPLAMAAMLVCAQAEAAPKETAVKAAAAKETAPKEAAPKAATSKETAPKGAVAKEAAPKDLAPTVRALMRDLDATEKATRDAAEQKLIALGAGALDALPEPTERMSAEVKLRLSRVRTQLELLQSKAVSEASTVTLKGDMTLLEALAELEKQTGNKLIDYREQMGQEAAEATVHTDFDKVPFWKALDSILDQAKLGLYGFSGEDGLAVVARNEEEGDRASNALYLGALRLDTKELNARRDLRNPMTSMLQVQLRAMWEPRLQPLLITHPADSIEAVGDDGAKLTSSLTEGEVELPVTPHTQEVEYPLQFALPDRKVTKIASLKGQLKLLLPGKIETFRFENLDKAKRVERHKGAVTVIFDEARKNNELFEVRVRIVFESADQALESHRDWISGNECYLEGADKKRIPWAANDKYREVENEVGYSYMFDVPDLKGVSLVYKCPSSIQHMVVPYELKNLDLP